MSRITRMLTELGLTPTEAELYLSGLKEPSLTANALTKHTGIQRTTVYNALETLIQKGFASKHQSNGNHLVFRMIEPALIEKKFDLKVAELEAKKQDFKKFLPYLERASGMTSKKLSVAHYEGIDGVKGVVEEALYCTSRAWDIIAPRNNFFSEFDASYAEYFLAMRIKNGIRSRSLWEKSPGWKKLSPEEVRIRNPRYLPDTLKGQYKSVIILFDDKVALISSLKNKSAIVIQSQELHDTMTALFNGLWEISTPYAFLKKETAHA